MILIWAVYGGMHDLLFGGVKRRVSVFCLIGLMGVCFVECVSFPCGAIWDNRGWKYCVAALMALVTGLIVQRFVKFGTADVLFITGAALGFGNAWIFIVLVACLVCAIMMLLLQKKRLPFIPFLAISMVFVMTAFPIAAENNGERISSIGEKKTSTEQSFEFVNQPITDILYAVSLFYERPVTSDDTVSGNASFRFTGGQKEQAFDAFLNANRLYTTDEDGVTVVSKMRIIHSDNGNIQLDAYDILPSQLYDKISVNCAVTIIYDVLPVSPVSVHIANVTPNEAVSLIARQIGGYAVREERNVLYVSKPIPVVQKIGNTGRASIKKIVNTLPAADTLPATDISPTATTFQVDVENESFTSVIELLFSEGKKEYCTLFKGQPVTSRAFFSGKDFDATLSLLCAQSGCAFTIDDGIYYLFETSVNDESLKNIGKSWQIFSLKYTSLANFVPMFQSRFGSLPLIQLPDGCRFICYVDKETANTLSCFVSDCDIPKKAQLVTLKYITTDDFLNHLPPSVRREQFSVTGRDNTLFFDGTDDAYNQLLTELTYIDKPVQCIRYDLLVIQYQKTSSFSHKLNCAISPMEPGAKNDLAMALGSVIALNIDVVSTFGLQFAAELEAAISANEAKVFADTTLQGVSGSSIDFQNTNTFRYRDSAVDPDTGKTVNTGVTREIVAGLMLNVAGWVSGDGMVTTKVKATVSRRGADTSSSTGNPPPTSEKSISTEVRSRSGEPVILSGLVQDDSTIVEERLPLISRIPILGWFFKNQTKTDESTEMVIYLVPHIVEGDK